MADREARPAIEWERIARRLLVLADYGYGLHGMAPHVDETDFLSDEWLERWWGVAPESYVENELDAIDLILGLRRLDREGSEAKP